MVLLSLFYRLAVQVTRRLEDAKDDPPAPASQDSGPIIALYGKHRASSSAFVGAQESNGNNEELAWSPVSARGNGGHGKAAPAPPERTPSTVKLLRESTETFGNVSRGRPRPPPLKDNPVKCQDRKRVPAWPSALHKSANGRSI